MNTGALSIPPQWCDFEPPLDVYDEGDAYRILVDIPGASPTSICIVQTGQTLLITGLRALHHDPGTRPHIEADYGRFRRHIEFPAPIQNGAHSAAYLHGLLIIHVPKCPLLLSA